MRQYHLLGKCSCVSFCFLPTDGANSSSLKPYKRSFQGGQNKITVIWGQVVNGKTLPSHAHVHTNTCTWFLSLSHLSACVEWPRRGKKGPWGAPHAGGRGLVTDCCVENSEKDATASNSLWNQKPCTIICMLGERKCVNCFPISEVTRK